jgi:hypothetical protein
MVTGEGLLEEIKMKASFSEKLKLWATAIGILSPILALFTFVGLKPEKKKQLEWEYVSKNSLVNPDAGSSEKIEVSYEGRKIKQLAVVSGRLLNNGTLPIESSDVKDDAYPTLEFRINVISAEIKSRNRNGIKAEISTTKDSVKIKNGLLNPGDELNIQILLEGDVPNLTELPNITYRIAGIEETSTKFPTLPAAKIRPAFFNFPPPIEYLILLAASFVALLPTLTAILFFTTAWEALWPENRIKAKLANLHRERMELDAMDASRKAEISDAHARATLTKAYSEMLPEYLRPRFNQLVSAQQAQPGDSITTYWEWLANLVEKDVLRFSIWDRINLCDKRKLLAGSGFGIGLLLLGASISLTLVASWYNLLRMS